MTNLLIEVCNNVNIEPHLQPIIGERFSSCSANTRDGARLDIGETVYGVGWPLRQKFFNVRIFNPYAPSNRQSNRAACYHKHEWEKKRVYERRTVEVEHASFTPLVMSTTGGLEQAATATYKRLATLLSSKWGQGYSPTMNWLRCRLSFSLHRSSIQAIRGARSSSGRASKPYPLPADLIIAESEMDTLYWTLNYYPLIYFYLFLTYFCLHERLPITSLRTQRRNRGITNELRAYVSEKLSKELYWCSVGQNCTKNHIFATL